MKEAPDLRNPDGPEAADALYAAKRDFRDLQEAIIEAADIDTDSALYATQTLRDRLDAAEARAEKAEAERDHYRGLWLQLRAREAGARYSRAARRKLRLSEPKDGESEG